MQTPSFPSSGGRGVGGQETWSAASQPPGSHPRAQGFLEMLLRPRNMAGVIRGLRSLSLGGSRSECPTGLAPLGNRGEESSASAPCARVLRCAGCWRAVAGLEGLRSWVGRGEKAEGTAVCEQVCSVCVPWWCFSQLYVTVWLVCACSCVPMLCVCTCTCVKVHARELSTQCVQHRA